MSVAPQFRERNIFVTQIATHASEAKFLDAERLPRPYDLYKLGVDTSSTAQMQQVRLLWCKNCNRHRACMVSLHLPKLQTTV